VVVFNIGLNSPCRMREERLLLPLTQVTDLARGADSCQPRGPDSKAWKEAPTAFSEPQWTVLK
jgi:hypothetical protein